MWSVNHNESKCHQNLDQMFPFYLSGFMKIWKALKGEDDREPEQYAPGRRTLIPRGRVGRPSHAPSGLFRPWQWGAHALKPLTDGYADICTKSLQESPTMTTVTRCHHISRDPIVSSCVLTYHEMCESILEIIIKHVSWIDNASRALTL